MGQYLTVKQRKRQEKLENASNSYILLEVPPFSQSAHISSLTSCVVKVGEITLLGHAGLCS